MVNDHVERTGMIVERCYYGLRLFMQVQDRLVIMNF